MTFGHGPAFNGFITLEIVVGPSRLRFRSGYSRLRLRDFGLADFHLRLRLIRLAARRRQISPGLGQARFVIARINFDEHVTLLDLLIVRDQQPCDLTRHARD